MSITQRLAGLVGVGGPRDDDPPRTRAIAPGVQVTDTEVWAWYEISHTNSDLKGEAGLDAEQDAVEVALRALAGRECQIRLLWARIGGEAYLAGLGLEQAPVNVREWAGQRADDIDDLDLPEQRRLLGVKIATRRPSAGTTGRAFGLDSGRVPEQDLKRYSRLALQVGGPLRAGVWRVRLAAPETIAWSISRELHRGHPVPAEDVITGATMARLQSGRVEFAPDHYTVMAANGEVATYGCVLALTDFPEVMVTPGQEWLALLGSIETSPLDTASGASVAVLPEASVRMSIPSSRQARRAIKEARVSAKEQRQSAARASAQEPEDAILQAEEELREVEFALSRRHTLLVHDHPRIVVTGSSREDLEAKVVAVVAAYDELGITATVMADEQREGWLECQPGDKVRVPDLGHWRDATALAQSWFWRGSRVGSLEPRTPAVGYTTGSTSGLVRFLATEAVTESDAPVTLFLGRTRRGKTTAMQIAMLDVCLAPENIERDPWGVLVDFKGDADGIIGAAIGCGIEADLIQVGPSYAGALCAFRTSDPEHAADNVVGQLALCLPRVLAEQATSLLQRAAARVASHGDPATWKVVEELTRIGSSSVEGSLPREVAETLQATTASGFGRLVAGRPEAGGQTDLPTRSGLTVLQLPGIAGNLPEVGTPEERWTPPQRVAVAALRGVLGWCATVAAAPAMRHRAKAIAFPEVHLLTATVEGRVYLTQVARMGAAFGVSLLLDTQDVTGVASLTGLAEGVADIFVFAQQTQAEQDAAARMLGLAVDEDTRRVIDGLDKNTATLEGGSHEVRRGHCLYRDRAGNVATMQWTVPSVGLREQLNTAAAATAARLARAGEPGHIREEVPS